jgi:hypothetical protein
MKGPGGHSSQTAAATLLTLSLTLASAVVPGVAIFSCSDPAADNNACRPPCNATIAGSTVNAPCQYSCRGVLAGLGLNSATLGYCHLPAGGGEPWPSPSSADGQRTLRAPLDKTSVIQGIRRSPDEFKQDEATVLKGRIDVRYAAL